MLIKAPAGYVSQHAIAFGAQDGTAISVDAANPLPTPAAVAASGVAPLAGSTAASGSFGPFVPALGRTLWVTLSGSWSGAVQLLRSTDGGTTRLPLTYPDGSPRASFAGNVNLAVGEETVAGASYYLAVTLTAGTLSYRVEQ
jgi:hypothetical protein